MLHDYLQVYSLSIVFIGDFNPVIIQPFWLANKKLIREQEAYEAEVEVLHNEINKFKLKDWLTVEITRDRFEMKTSQEPYFAPMKDLAISIFKALNETPIKAVGINHIKSFTLPTDEDYYKFGNALVPLNNWSEYVNEPKVLSLDIIEQNRIDGLNGHLRIRIQPADIKLPNKNSIIININDHYSLSPGLTGRNGEIIDILGKHFNNSQDRSIKISEKIWEKIQN